ncbi:hypothetical protein [Pragia fontium]|uniref:Uncharacterized protein n=1 Tax=Pragia fontium DSM 5563 = ATCC 49100 TaxID=1122977 RepID=A0AAJ4WD40_9GAMM|nr:hypothetical protein [Pragia fontium]SFD31773.1 hypothetical protein SAMN02745723_11326 [Pragia fontium DSM 5563 = ATCC 49100]
MLALPFELFGFSQYIENEPAMMAFVASFGVLLAAFMIGLFMRLPLVKPIFATISGGLALGLFPGFGLSMILVFSGISGIHILLSWLIVILTSISFVAFNYRRLANWMTDFTATTPEKAPKSKQSPKRRRK